MLGKAPIETPRRAMGNLLGHAVRFGVARDVMVAGEGIETILSLRMILPGMPMAAALSAAHLAAILFPVTLRRLYIARDNDPAGDSAMETLINRARDVGIEAIELSPQLGDFNEESAPSRVRCAARRNASPDRPGRCRPVHAWCSRGREGGGDRLIVRAGIGWGADLHRRGPRPRPSSEGDRTANGADRQWLRPVLFRQRLAASSIASQKNRPSPSSAGASALPLRVRVQVRPARRLASP